MTILLVATLFIALASAVGSEIVAAQNATKTRLGTSRARFAAYAGLQHAILRIKAHDYANLEGVLLPGSDTVSYSVQIFKNDDDTPVTPLEIGVTVPPNSIYLSAMGVDGTQAEVALHAMSGLVSETNTKLKYGAFTDQNIELTGSSKSLSYDSAAIQANPTPFTVNQDTGIITPAVTGAAGDLGTNRTVTIDSPAGISGDIYRPVSGANPLLPANVVTNDANLLTGFAESNVAGDANEVRDLSAPVELPKFSAPAAASILTSIPVGTTNLTPSNSEEPLVYDRLNVAANSTMTQHGGRYFFPNGMQIDGLVEAAADVGATNPIVIFVGGDVKLGDTGQFNLNGLPSNVQLYFVNKRDVDQKFQMQGESKFFGTVMGNRVKGYLSEQAQLFGGFMGRSMSAKDSSEIVFDEKLREASLAVKGTWGLNGVTEPEPEVVISKSTFLGTYVAKVQTNNITYKTPVGTKKAILQEELAPLEDESP